MIFVLPEAPPLGLSDLAGEVDRLLDIGALNHGHANALNATLNAATRQREAGNTGAHIAILGAFINQVHALERAGKLSPTQAHELVSAAQKLIDGLTG